jgi:hypothetical protein
MAANSFIFSGRKVDIYNNKQDGHREMVDQNLGDIDITEIENLGQSVTTIRAYIENTCIKKGKRVIDTYIGSTYKLLQNIDTRIMTLLRHKKFEIDPQMKKVHLADLEADDIQRMITDISHNIEQIDRPAALPQVTDVDAHVLEQVQMAMKRLANRTEALRAKIFVRANNGGTTQSERKTGGITPRM